MPVDLTLTMREDSPGKGVFPSANVGKCLLDQLTTLAVELKLDALRPQIAACRHQLQGDGGVEVAVFGRFKAGKSSFLNHLAGREVLPVGVVPLTAVITRLRFGPAERAEVRFQNGTVHPIRWPTSPSMWPSGRTRTTGNRLPRWRWSCPR